MHPYVLISLFSALAAGMLAGAIWARDANNRGNQLAGLLLAAGSFWSLCDVLANTAADGDTALTFVRLSCLGSIVVPPLAFHMLLTLEPALQRRYARFLHASYASGIFFAVLAASTDAMWADPKPASWGWAAESRWGVAVSWVILVPFPAAALVDWYRLKKKEQQLDSWMGIAVGIPALIATLTDFLLPLIEFPFPRLGSVSLVTWGAVAMWKVYRFRDPILAPHLFAREILATLPDGVVLLRLDGTIRASNDRMAALTGRSAVDLTGHPISDFLIKDDETPTPDHSGRAHLLRQTSGESISVVADETALHDDEGNALGHVLVIRDLREVISLRSRLITSGRLTAVGQLAAGIAHEINNPIAYVQSDLNLLREHWDALTSDLDKGSALPEVARILEEGSEMIAESSDGLDRIAAIVRDVGGFSPSTRTRWEEADLSQLIDTAIRVAKPQLRTRASVEREYGQLPLIQCVPQELMQVFLNLLLNAAQAMDSPGTIRLQTHRDGDFACVSVTDDGVGMSSQAAAQAFTPFFTTKPVGEGTGLGLSISLQIVEKHRGDIDVESAPGQGAVFRIRLPLRATGNRATGKTLEEGACDE